MLERCTVGEIPRKPHTAFRSPEGGLYREHCLTREGFGGGYTISYHHGQPTGDVALEAVSLPRLFSTAARGDQVLARRHLRTLDVPPGPDLASARTLLLHNADCGLSVAQPEGSGSDFFINGDADELFFLFRGAGVLESLYGPLPVRANDYVWVPCGMPYRFRFDAGETRLLIIEGTPEIGIPAHYRNVIGQLTMEAPYSHRDFRRPTTLPESDGDGPWRVLIKRSGQVTAATWGHFPLDAVGWDGTVYPVAFNILDFQPKVGLVHLPPPVHTTFSAAGFVVCSFVPRPLDFHPEAVPCPFAHSSVHADEVLFYVSGNFTSRRGIEAGSISLHPAGLPHGPHPGAYEGSIGHHHTDELAVMLDTFRPLQLTTHASAVEDPNYPTSWAG